MLRNQWIALAGFILLCLAVGSLGGYAVSASIVDWYPTLNKPSWNPPNWLFGPVWTVLYVMMAVAAWGVWRSKDRIGPAMILFFSQLALNLAWSFLFFGARSPWLGLVEITFLWLALVFTIIAFFGRVTWAGWLMLPYLAWVSFAAFLNFTIWRLN
jgi:tryptophan-rich sensory protein